MTDIAHVVGYMLLKLGKHTCITTEVMANWCIPLQVLGSSKQHIEGEFSVDGGGNVRVILATTALDMGVNYPDVKYIIHFLSPAQTLEVTYSSWDVLVVMVVRHMILLYTLQEDCPSVNQTSKKCLMTKNVSELVYSSILMKGSPH